MQVRPELPGQNVTWITRMTVPGYKAVFYPCQSIVCAIYLQLELYFS